METGAARPQKILLIIDVQVGLVELIPAEIQGSVLPRIGTLVAKARASGTPVIYIQHDGSKGHVLEPGTRGWGIYPSLKPSADESIIRKRESDSFFETMLQKGTQETWDYSSHHRGRHNGIRHRHNVPTCDQFGL